MNSHIMRLLAAMTLMLSPAIQAKPTFSHGIELYESQDGGVYTTTWKAYPMTINSFTGKNFKTPDGKMIALTADGKTSNFRGVLEISCSKPVYSNIVSSEDYKSLKEAMADSTLPRPVVNKLFATFCK